MATKNNKFGQKTYPLEQITKNLSLARLLRKIKKQKPKNISLDRRK